MPPLNPAQTLRQAAALWRSGQIEAAHTILAPLAARYPREADVLLEYGMVRAAMGDADGATATFRRALAARPDHAPSWRALADMLVLDGDLPEAGDAYANGLKAGLAGTPFAAQAAAIAEGRAAQAEATLKAHLRATPNDVTAIYLLGEAAMRVGRTREAEAVFAHCLDIAPGYAAARRAFAVLLLVQGKWAEAVPHLAAALAAEPRAPALRWMATAAMTRCSRHAESVPIYQAMLADFEPQPRAWLMYGHALKMLGRSDEAARAYRRALELAPGSGEAYLSLAEIKTAPLRAGEIAALREHAQGKDVLESERPRLHYALAQALERSGDFAGAFSHFAEGARLRRQAISDEEAAASAVLQAMQTLCTPAFFAACGNGGHPSAAPIFVVGMPRAGSTLVEQILASHPQVEGTTELPEMNVIAQDLGGSAEGYPGVLAVLDAPSRQALGARYLARAESFRATNRPRFIDKLPGNFVHAPLIHLILPNATIIDVRRRAMAAGFAMFKQYFHDGHFYSYDFNEIARAYTSYTRFMARMDAALPGRIHHVHYEDLVADTEGEIRRLLDACGLAFDPACLRFWETERAVQTPSAEQVRQPVYTSGLEHWRKYESQLEPLRHAFLQQGLAQEEL